MKLFTAAMATETNAFCPIPTIFEDFKYGIGEESSLDDYFKVFRSVAEKRGWIVEHGPSYHASPLGKVIRSAYEKIKEDILNSVIDAI